MLVEGFAFWQYSPVEYHAIAVAWYSTNTRLRLLNIWIYFLINLISISMYIVKEGNRSYICFTTNYIDS